MEDGGTTRSIPDLRSPDGRSSPTENLVPRGGDDGEGFTDQLWGRAQVGQRGLQELRDRVEMDVREPLVFDEGRMRRSEIAAPILRGAAECGRHERNLLACLSLQV